MATPILDAAVTGAFTGLFVGVVHYAVHTWRGDERDFEDAGVMSAGIAVSAAGFAIGFIGMLWHAGVL